MANSFAATRAQLIFALCLPLAVLLGYLLAEPLDLSNMAIVVLVLGVLSIPLLMHWYHPLLILTWNAAITPFFLPGSPFIWMLFAFIGFGFAVVNRFTSADKRFISLPSVNWSLLALLAVVLGTAYLRGGMGMRIFRSGQQGGKAYFYIIAAVLGYFALISQQIPKNRVGLAVSTFFLSGLTSLVPNLAYLGGPGFEFLFYLFPPVYALEQVVADYSVTNTLSRALGVTYASIALYSWLMARYGLRGIFNVTKPLRLTLFLLAVIGILFSGYRSYVLLFLFTITAQFFAEKLFRLRVILIGGASLIMVGAVLMLTSDRLPLVVQRSISFLPVSIDPSIRARADSSSDWRFKMWQEVLPMVPKYLLMGKGFAVDPTELELAIHGSSHGFGPSYSWALLSGSYHSGPLTLIVPLGLWGFAAFVWFAIASIKYLYRNSRVGEPELKNINTFLLACFVARLAYFTLVFGNFFSDFFVFSGIVGFSACLNGTEPPEKEEEADETEAAHNEEFGALAER
jgi:hypothetical protein